MSGLHHLALRVAEPTASARFYVEVLGLRELQVHRDEDGTARSVWLALGEGAPGRRQGERDDRWWKSRRPGGTPAMPGRSRMPPSQ